MTASYLGASTPNDIDDYERYDESDYSPDPAPARYRKKPIEIEAFQYGLQSEPDWFNEAEKAKQVVNYIGPSGLFVCDIITLEGTMQANTGDWIIKGVKGELYPCKDDIFQATYDPVP